MVRIEGLRKSFGSLEVLRNINLDVMPGQGGDNHWTVRLRQVDAFCAASICSRRQTPATYGSTAQRDLAADHVNVNALREKIGMVFSGIQPL